MRRPALRDLPNWPRFLDHAQAAAYVSTSVSTFDAEVRAGIWPKGRRRMHLRGRTDSGERGILVWDRAALDAAADRISGTADEVACLRGEEILNATTKDDWTKKRPQKKA
jgi:hypothetical protein